MKKFIVGEDLKQGDECILIDGVVHRVEEVKMNKCCEKWVNKIITSFAKEKNKVDAIGKQWVGQFTNCPECGLKLGHTK